MFIVREVFTAKPGSASKLAKLFKDALTTMPGVKSRVLTDHIASFNTVVFETEVEDLGQFEKMLADYATSADIRERMKGYTDMYVEGRREVYKVT